MVKVILVKDFELAKETAKEIAPCCAIECEFGDNTITEENEGVIEAFYHHGEHSNNKPPCLRWDIFDKYNKGLDNFLISHIDLDTIFGILWASKILRPTRMTKEIAKLVAIQDLNGFHYLEANILNDLDEELKYRFLGIGYMMNIFKFEDDNQLKVDFSRNIHKLLLKIKDIIIEGIDNDLKEKINLWLSNKKIEAEKLLKDYENNLFNYFIKNGSINPLSAYILSVHDKYAKVNIVYNTETGIISISAFNDKEAKEIFGENGVITPLQKFFGEDAGGRISVGGSPRNKFIAKEKADAFVSWIKRNYFNLSTNILKKISI